jgi:glycosyltransferase involved in cell wall biosynthesis
MRIVETLDIIHIHDPFSISDIGLGLAQRYKIPLVFTNHTRHDIYLQNYSPLTKRFLQRYMEYQLRRIITNAAQVTGPSADTVSWLQSLVQTLDPIYRDRIQVVNNPINLHKFADPTPRISRTTLKIAPSTTIPTRVAAAAWGAYYTADCVDGPTLDEFVATKGQKGPEDVCAAGQLFP